MTVAASVALPAAVCAAASLAAALCLRGRTGEAADPDPDLQAVQAVCGRCHTTAVFLNKPRSWDRWNDVFADMTQRGANGTDEQLARVTTIFPGEPHARERQHFAGR